MEKPTENTPSVEQLIQIVRVANQFVDTSDKSLCEEYVKDKDPLNKAEWILEELRLRYTSVLKTPNSPAAFTMLLKEARIEYVMLLEKIHDTKFGLEAEDPHPLAIVSRIEYMYVLLHKIAQKDLTADAAEDLFAALLRYEQIIQVAMKEKDMLLDGVYKIALKKISDMDDVIEKHRRIRERQKEAPFHKQPFQKRRSLKRKPKEKESHEDI